MLRSDRLLVIALGLVIAGASEPSKGGAQPNQSQASQELPNAAPSLLPVPHIEISDKEDVGCVDKKDNRSSDLCAQWKAADAANQAAHYAYISILVGLFGTILIVLTFWETRKTSRIGLRAYVTHQETTTNYFSDANRLTKIQFVFTWKNSGATPALRVRTSMNRHWFPGSGLPRDFTFPDIITPGPLKDTRHLGPDLVMDCPMMVPLEALKLDERGVTFFYGWVEYDDIYRNRHRTELCFELQFLGDGSLAQTPLRLSSRGPFNGMDSDCFHKVIT